MQVSRLTTDHTVLTVARLTVSKILSHVAGYTLLMESNLNVQENLLSPGIVVSITKAIVRKTLSLVSNAVNSPKNLSDLDFSNKIVIHKYPVSPDRLNLRTNRITHNYMHARLGKRTSAQILNNLIYFGTNKVWHQSLTSAHVILLHGAELNISIEFGAQIDIRLMS